MNTWSRQVLGVVISTLRYCGVGAMYQCSGAWCLLLRVKLRSSTNSSAAIPTLQTLPVRSFLNVCVCVVLVSPLHNTPPVPPPHACATSCPQLY